ncbi:hypothetical protein E3N88_00375 [Mikania micrantha]|uniref:Uncharacterized protein n=1 Tax=Mikania micrantha TaxID=192012 RepID=A0A5N6PXX4_9ASTR|nr:hypothetical protein E3N88_00375 [Mikania micrantha]
MAPKRGRPAKKAAKNVTNPELNQVHLWLLKANLKANSILDKKTMTPDLQLAFKTNLKANSILDKKQCVRFPLL